MPAIINLVLPRKDFYIFREDLEEIRKICDFSHEEPEKENDSYWDDDELYKIKVYIFNIGWDLLDIIGNRTTKLSEFYSDVEIEKFPYNFYKESKEPSNRSVFLSTWEYSINPFLLNDFLIRFKKSEYFFNLDEITIAQIDRLLTLSVIAMKYSIRLPLTLDPD